MLAIKSIVNNSIYLTSDFEMTDLKMNQMAKKMELVISHDLGNEITIPFQVSVLNRISVDFICV